MSEGSTIINRLYRRYEAYENLMASFDDEDVSHQMINTSAPGIEEIDLMMTQSYSK